MYMPELMGIGTLKPFDPIRLAINQLFLGATTVPQISSTVEVDMSQIAAIREQEKDRVERLSGAKLGFMPFFVKAAAKGLRACPEANAMLIPGGLWLHRRVHMGISVPTPNGVVVPVVRDPDKKSVLRVAQEIDAFARLGRQGLIRPHECVGSTFGLTNSGTLGMKRDIPMVIPPHTAVLACAAVEKRPVVVGDELEVRPVMEATLSFDHRAMDGDGPERFFGAFRDYLEHAQFT